MKKFLAFLLIIVAISCSSDKEEDSINDNETSFQNSTIYEKIADLEGYNLYKETNDYMILENNYTELVENIDTTTYREYSKDGVKYYDIKSILDEKFIGSIIFFKNSKNEYYTKVETYDYDINEDIERLNIKSKEGDLIYSLNVVLNSDDEKVLVLDSDSMNGDILSSQRRSWWTCTRQCTVDAVGACYTDGTTNGCADWCTVLLATCWDAVGTSCAIWCAIDTDNDLTP